MNSFQKAAALSALAMACYPVVASAQVLFSDDFDAGTSAARYDQFSQDNDGVGTDDVSANFNFDYGNFKYWHIAADESTQHVGEFIPLAPRSTGTATIGLRLDANNLFDPANTATGESAVINLYPKLNQYVALPSGDHKLTFDMWMNYNGRYRGGPGSMEWFTAGVNQAGGGIGGLIPVGDPNNAGFAMAVNGERTNGLDYRFYRNNTRLGSLDASSGYVAQDEGDGLPGPADGDNQFYAQLFPFVNPNDASDAWYETFGGIGKHWTTVEIRVEDEIVHYYMKPDGASDFTLIAARTDPSVTSGQIMVGYSDTVRGVAALEDGDSTPGSGAYGDHNFGLFDNIVVETVTQVRPTWTNATGGNWSNGGNWVNGVPNATNHVADFKSAISAPQTVTVDGAKTVRSLVFDNANSYTVAGDQITIDGFTSGVLGTLQVDSGSHTVSAPLQLNKDTRAKIASGGRLNLSGDVTAAPDLGITKSGGGTLEMKHVRMDRLQIDGGSVEVTPNGGAQGTSVVKSLTVSPGGAFRLNDNDLIVDYADDATTSPEVAIRDLVKAGRVDGSTTGIFSTPGATKDNVLLAVVDNADWGQSTYNGINVDTSTVIGKYTYFGDANLDGRVTGDDYVAVDSNLGTGDSWIEGDFNMDGRVSGDDYVAIDSNLGSGTPDPLAFAELKAEMVALHVEMFGEGYLTALAAYEAEMAVPEPGALSLIGLGALGLLSRRRRR